MIIELLQASRLSILVGVKERLQGMSEVNSRRYLKLGREITDELNRVNRLLISGNLDPRVPDFLRRVARQGFKKKNI